MMLYKLRIDTIKDESRCERRVYGIDVYERIRSIPDIFTDEEQALVFVDLCNAQQLSPIHIDDVIQDTLGK